MSSRRKKKKLSINELTMEFAKLKVAVDNNKQFQDFVVGALEYHGFVYREGDQWKITPKEEEKEKDE